MSAHVKSTVVVLAVGFVGGLYYCYRLYKQKTKKRVIVIPEVWTYAGKLEKMYIYPIKSCGPVMPKRAECNVLGLKYGWIRDRVLMVVDNKNHFITARAYPELLKVLPEVQGSVVTLKHPDMEPWSVHLAENSEDFSKKATKATVWGIELPVRECSNDWFNRLLKTPEKNFHMVKYAAIAEDKSRGYRSNSQYPGTKYTENDTGAFPDEVSYNLINEASVQELNSRLQETQVTHVNFRPNFVLAGGPAKAYDEDNWQFIRIGPNVFEIIKPCTRCVLTTIDPETGVKNVNQEPLTTLKTYRKIEDLTMRRIWGASPRMGVQMALRSGPGGSIVIGDDVYYA